LVKFYTNLVCRVAIINYNIKLIVINLLKASVIFYFKQKQIIKILKLGDRLT
jgi:hypothetical protein